MKCHYIPKFYLKRWAVDGELVEYQRRKPDTLAVTPMRRSPAGTGWKKDLYTFEGLPDDKRHLVERVFFSMLDSKAADALDLMETGSDAWTNAIREAWCLFLISLITRHPADIVALKQVYRRDFLKASEEDQEAYAKARQTDHPPTVEEYFRQFHPDVVGNMAMNTLPKMVMHQRAVNSLMMMHWTVTFAPDEGYFLTSDRPTIRTFLGKPNSHWLVPIGPRRLFIAAEQQEYGQQIRAAVRKQGWKEVNRQVVRHAVDTAYADTDRHLPFVQKHLAKDTSKSGFSHFVSDPWNAPPLRKVP